MAFSRVHLNVPEQPITIRGFVSRYRELSCGPLTFEDDREGFFERGSHADMLASGAPVHLQYGSHDERSSPKLAFTSDASLQMFESSLGLHFEATIFPSEHPEIWSFLDKVEWIGVSKDCLPGCVTEETKFEGKSVWRVKSHALSNIALLPEGKFMNARAWRPDRISTNGVAQAFDAEWLKGQAEARRSQRARRARTSSEDTEPAKTTTSHKMWNPPLDHKSIRARVRPGLRMYSIADMDKLERMLTSGPKRSTRSSRNTPQQAAVAAYANAFARMRG